MPSSQLKAMIMAHEGFKLAVYDDATGLPIVPGSKVVGHPTIGCGRCLDTNGISKQEVMMLLDTDLSVAESGAESFSWYKNLNAARQDVVISMIFNIGLNGFRKFKKLIAAIESQRFDDAANEMLSSVWASQVKSRATELARIMKYGKYLPKV